MVSEEKIFELLSGSRDIVIAGHVNPDGDAVGASLAFGMSLKKIGKEPKVLLENYSEKYDIIPGAELIYTGDITELSPDVFMAVDCSGAERLGDALQVMKRAKTTICVDHHINEGGFAEFDYIDENAASSSELVFRIISYFSPIDKDIAVALYTGIVFDTGGFRHPSTSPETHRMCAKLLETGIPFSDAYNEIMYKHSVNEAKALAKAIDRLEIIDGAIGYSYILDKDLKAMGGSYLDLDGVVEYLLNFRGMEAAVLIYELSAGLIKVSMRSRNINVGEIAAELGGGGHKLASGCNFAGTVEEVAEKVIPFIKKSLKAEKCNKTL